MENINRVDIYVGEVGVAYVDKETAKKRLEAAQKNIKDMEDILASAQTTKVKAENALNDANDALTEASTVLAKLNTSIAQFEPSNTEGTETINPKYELLSKLRNDLETNDFDNIGLNGGSENTAQINIDELTNQSQKAQDIIDEANGYLSEDGRLVQLKNQCQEEYDHAVEIFKGYLPEEYEDNDDVSDEIERDLIERINAVNAAVENAQNITDAINNTSSKVSTRITEIIGELVTITLVIENGYSENASQSITVSKGEQASWTVYANNGYRLPDTVTNGQINGNQVTSNNADDNLEVRVICVKNDGYYLYFGKTELTVDNFNNEFSNGIIHNTYDSSSAPAQFNYATPTNTYGLYYVVYPVSWGTINIQTGSFPNAIDNVGTITVDSVEYYVKSTGLVESTYTIWFT